MKKYDLYIFLILLAFSFSTIPLWNFSNTVTDLLSSSTSYNITLYENEYDSKTYKIIKTISKIGNLSTEKNILKIDEDYEKETNWEDIESIYKFNDVIYICPRGKNYINKFTQSKEFQEIIPNGFTATKDWDLICYYQTSENYFFMAFANNYNLIYYTKNVNDLSISNNWYNNGGTQVYEGLCDFKWTTDKDPNDTGNNNYLMTSIIIRDNYLILEELVFIINGNNRQEDVNRRDGQGKLNLINDLSNSYGYFNKDDYSFYFFSYNDTYLQIGYYETNGNSIDYSQMPIIKEQSPLDFFYDFKIEKIKYLRNSNYIYYEIYNEIIETKYYGFIDIKLNEIIFNTDEEILSYNKISTNTLLIRTKDSAYSICKIKEDNNCIDSCNSNEIIINSLGSNFCGKECPKLIMKPNNICIDECDEKKYYKIENQCGLCKDLNGDKKYKIINTTGCIEYIPEGAEYYINKNNILKCKEEYYLNEESCFSIPTIETTLPSKNPSEISCKEDEGILKYINPKNNSETYRCIKKSSQRVYYDAQEKYFKLCYETCLTCNQGGNKNRNNCIKCEKDYREIKIDDYSNEFNCYAKCPYFYINSYNQYKCLDHLPCPKEAKYFINNKKQCIDNCKKDSQYIFAYNGNCIKECPNGTEIDNNDNTYNICKDLDNSFKLAINNLELNYTSFIGEIDTYVERYSDEFKYTNKHVTQYKSEEYTAIIYKDLDSINELSLDFPNFDFGKCYEEVKRANNISQELIVVIINKNDDDNNPDSSYSFYHPITGKKLQTEEICKGFKVNIIENIISLIKNLNNSDSIISLANQGINIFNKSDKFYTDLCYDFNIETKKDIALQDRLKLFYPNITLCDDECNQTHVDLEKMTAHCECEFNEITTKEDKIKKNNIFENVLIENLMGNVLDFIDSSNIGVGKCLKKSVKYIIKSYGLYISLFVMSLHIILSVLFFISDLKKIQIYIYENTSNYLQYISFPEEINHNEPPSKKHKTQKLIFQTGEKKSQRKINYRKHKTVNITNNKIENLNLIISIRNNNKDSNQSILKFEKNHMLKVLEKNRSRTEKYKNYFDKYFAESLDELEFDDAIRQDHRKFLVYFLDCLKEKQIILNTFLAYEPFKPRAIKIILFLLTLFLYFIVNALFINDSYVSKVYNLEEDKFFDFVPRSIDRFFFTTLVGFIIEFIVDFFFVKEKKMKRIFIREKDDSLNIKKEIVILVSLIKKRYISFIIFVYIILIICFYYLICFNSIYPNMQIEWIKSSIFIRQILSILQCLLETILRTISFRYENEKIFKISKLIV